MKVTVHSHAFKEAPQEFQVDCLAQWFLERYEGRPGGRPRLFVGEPSTASEITGDPEAILAGAESAYTVLETPGMGAESFAVMLIQMAASYAINDYMMAPKKALDTKAQESPNNQLSGRGNQIRTMQRVEDIYGTVRAVPSLMMQTYTKYIQNRKVEYGYYCVGRGYYSIDDLRDGDTRLSDISGASAAIYWPFTSPNSGSPVSTVGDAIIDPILNVSRSSSVEGVVLKPINQLQLQADKVYVFIGPSASSSVYGTTTLDVIFQPALLGRHPNFTAVAEVGQTVDISMTPVEATRHSDTANFSVSASTNTYTCDLVGFFRGFKTGTPITVSGFGTSNDGVKTVVSATSTTLTVAEACVNDAAAGAFIQFVGLIDYSQSGRTISIIGDGFVVLNGSPQFAPDPLDVGLATATVEVNNSFSEWTDWFTLPATDRTEVWTNVLAQGGVYKDDGSKSATTVEYEIQIEQLTSLLAPTGTVETVTGSLSGSTSNERAETLERVTAWTGPARVRARRTTPFDYDFEGLVVDEIALVDLYSVVPIAPADYPHFGNKTTIHTITRATADSTSVRQRQLNCLASRKLPTYLGGTSFSGAFDSTGLLVSGTIAATSRIQDILPAIVQDPKIGNRSLSDLDMAQVAGVQAELDAWHSEVGQFNYTFASDNLSFEETITTIANAAFCAAYRQNGVIRLALDRPQATSTALFTHRNKKPKSETITRQFASDSDFDGVELMYLDPETETQETIRLPLDGSYTKLKKVEITGIRSYEQAWFRANRELARLLSQRLTIETVCTTDARALLPNSRIDIVDNTRIKSYDGEVVGQSGLTITLSRDVEFIPATPHSIVLMKRDGSLQSIACTAGAAANQVVLAGTPSEAIVTEPTYGGGIRTIFSFAADSARAAMAWLVQEIDVGDGQYVRIRGVNYSDDYYAADEVAVPAKAGVIY